MYFPAPTPERTEQEVRNGNIRQAMRLKEQALQQPSLENVWLFRDSLKCISTDSAAEVLSAIALDTKTFLEKTGDYNQYIDVVRNSINRSSFKVLSLVEYEKSEGNEGDEGDEDGLRAEPLPTLNNLMLNGVWESVAYSIRLILPMSETTMELVRNVKIPPQSE